MTATVTNQVQYKAYGLFGLFISSHHNVFFITKSHLVASLSKRLLVPSLSESTDKRLMLFSNKGEPISPYDLVM